MKILRLSHTSKKSGGYRHERLLADNISKTINSELIERHYPGVFKSIIDQLKLALIGFTKTTADINVVVARFAIGALVKSIISKKQVLLVMHNWDENDEKSTSLKYYYSLLWLLLKIFSPKRFSLVCISDYWKTVFNKLLQNKIPVFVYPNLLDSLSYSKYNSAVKKKQIYLGQASIKNDYKALEKIDRHFSDKGYYCFYSSIIQNASVPYSNHNLLIVSEERYLEELASSVCSISFPCVEDGWSRIAHESFLVGTPVLAFKKGGLQHLVQAAGGYLVDSVEEAVSIIENGLDLDHAKVKKLASEYDLAKSDDLLIPIIRFIQRNT